ncbi:MAG TPA: hypothetical protein PLL75_06260 [Candidatus Omnitrophota bacterium]|nr:hypothetical protein [Candidatus Omnitrophota bacterium]HPS37313.1 hypothetical protein [Candidatus Omnitrophota bacterium]
MPDFFTALRNNRKTIFLLALPLLAGILARFWGLAWHFTSTDDLGTIEHLLIGQSQHDIFFIPKTLTNAPFQYLITYFLISPAMDYRQLLFWARLPSCIFSCLALLALVFFYRRYDKEAVFKCFLALMLLACSWENIAFAKLTHSYAIGVLASALFCWLFIAQITAKTFTLKRAFATGVVLAALSSMQYQILLFVPAFYLALFVFRFRTSENRANIARSFLVSAVFFVFLVFPLWYFFLKPQYFDFARKVQWAFGPSGEYAFPKTAWSDIPRFYLGTLLTVFQTKTGFFPENHPLFGLFSISLYLLFLLGVLNFLISPKRQTRSLGLLFGLSLLTWWIMVPVKSLPWSPSRHTLILLPFLCITAAEGWEGLSGLFRMFSGKAIPERWLNRFLLGTGLLILGTFVTYYGVFLKERRDPIEEKEICRILETYDPDILIYDKRGFHLEFMKQLKALYEKMLQKPVSEVRTFAILTRYPAASVQKRCEYYREIYNYFAAKGSGTDPGTPPALIRSPCSEFTTVYHREIDSEVTEMFTHKIKADIFTNRFFFYILSVDPEKKKIADILRKPEPQVRTV